MKEIDIIIEEGLKKIVGDKIDQHLGNIDYYIKDIISERYKSQFKELDISKIIEKFSYKDLISRLSGSQYPYRDNKLNSIISEGLEKGIEKFLAEELKLFWHNRTSFNDKNLKSQILEDEKVNKSFIDFIKKFFN